MPAPDRPGRVRAAGRDEDALCAAAVDVHDDGELVNCNSREMATVAALFK